MSESLNYSVEKIVEMCSWIYFQGFTGDSCGACKKTVNILDGIPGWMCPNCGSYNAMPFHGSGRIPFESPDYGPSREHIQEAYRLKGESDA